LNEKIRLLVVDDHPLVRKGIVAVLETEPDMEVVGECSDGAEAVAQAEKLKPDVILLDLMMPHMDGVEAAQKIKETAPDTQILVLTSFGSADKIFPALNAGVTGYLLKDSDPGELQRAIRRVHRGENYLHPKVTRELLNRMAQPPEPQASQQPELLTERELEVLRCIARGMSNAEIAQQLVVSEATVHTHVNRVLTKLNLNSRTQAAIYALKKGLVPLDE
jgi:NarL family two-component system response regulator LiaR